MPSVYTKVYYPQGKSNSVATGVHLFIKCLRVKKLIGIKTADFTLIKYTPFHPGLQPVNSALHLIASEVRVFSVF